MALSQWGLMGALAGAVIGYLNYRLIAGIVETRLRALDKSANATELDAFERKIVQMRQLFLTLEIGILAIVGYVVGAWFGG
jgi:hypothetical protein